MREIKFRFRLEDKETKERIVTYAELYNPKYSSDLMQYPINLKEFNVLSIDEYTGFKDVNKKEIYTNDIIEKIGIIGNEVFELKKDYIEINTPQLGNVLIFTDILYDRKTGYKELFVKENTNGILPKIQNYEVIGNIYDNIELLEDN